MSRKRREKDGREDVIEPGGDGRDSPRAAPEPGAAAQDRRDQRDQTDRQDDGGESPAQPDVVGSLEAAKSEAAENYDRYVRAQAELQNVLKRHERDRAERVKYAAEALGRDLLEIVDDLERALDHAGAADADLVAGVKMVRERLLAALERHGIERIASEGQPFDPSIHEAVATVESAAHEPNTVADEHRPGYRIHDRLLRAAMVAVSKAPAADDGKNDSENSGD